MRYFLVLMIFLGLSVSVRAQLPAAVTWEALHERAAAGQDTLYVLNFWATWCRPCVEEMPYFEVAGKEFASKKVKVIFVSLDLKSEYEGRLATFLKKRHFDNEVLWLNEPKIQTKIDEINPEWTGAIPATLFFHANSRTQSFHEGDFTQETLNAALADILSRINQN
jgi:thiol-disulfide isomerase/thioredoxin